MIINRQNYQIWITDYYDGRLDDFQAEVLMDFLSDNPDLRTEFEDYPGLSVSPAEHSGPDKSLLLRTPDELTNEQVEHFSIAYCENDLDEKQKREIAVLAGTDPRFRKNISTYEKIKLKADETAYPAKSALLKIPGRRRKTGILLTWLSTAASIAILAGLFLILNRQSPGPTMEMQVLASAGEDESGETREKEEPSRPVSGDELPADTDAGKESTDSHITGGKDSRTLVVAESPKRPATPDTQIIKADPEPLKREIQLAMMKIPAIEEIKLNNQQLTYLLADTKPYMTSLPLEQRDSLRMSIREFLAFHFRKNILDKEDPGIENLKAWEIADAGIKGINTLLGWNMEFQADQGEDGKLQKLHFTSELVKIDHKFNKNNQGL